MAVGTGEGLRLVYQPWIHADTGSVAGVEALLRWEHPELGMVPTERFAALAEETDLIVPLGQWAMNEACSQMREWHDSGLEKFAVSINVSPRQLRRGNLAEMVEETLQRTELDASWLKVELTERTLVEDTETARRTLERLRAIGVTIAIDDFGTGYSSLSYLKSFPIDAIKIDREFVRDSVTDADTATVAESMVSLAHSLRLDVIADRHVTMLEVRIGGRVALSAEYTGDAVVEYGVDAAGVEAIDAPFGGSLVPRATTMPTCTRLLERR